MESQAGQKERRRLKMTFKDGRPLLDRRGVPHPPTTDTIVIGEGSDMPSGVSWLYLLQ